MTRISPTAILRNVLQLLVPVSVALTIYVYLFPVFSSCAFPLPPGHDADTDAFHETAKLHWPLNRNSSNATATAPPPSARFAPFRLLTLADPQLEGDTSIPDAYGGPFPHLRGMLGDLTFQSTHVSIRQRIRSVLHEFLDIFLEDIFNTLESFRKRMDLFGNDFYLAHIYRTLHWWTIPTHVTVLGDLLGSQWVDDAEFHRRAHRYWNRVFRNGERLPDELALQADHEYDLSGFLGGPESNDTKAWTRRILNVAGNHDIGYAGDINDERIARFEAAFGKLNYELRFELPVANATYAHGFFDGAANVDSNRLVPELRVIVLNDMNLDTPAQSTEIQDATYSFVNNVIGTATAVEFEGHFTLVLTHVPLYKPGGICVDEPFFDFHDYDGSLKEQNQLSAPASKGFLEGIFGMSSDENAPAHGAGRPGLILNGHDHAGCDTWHFVDQTRGEEEREWDVYPLDRARAEGIPGKANHPGIREITVRSMMGDFGGNAGLLSMWFDEASWEWRYEWVTCPLGTQHLWWLAHILDFVSLVGIALTIVAGILSLAGVDVDGAVLNCAAAAWRLLGADRILASLASKGASGKTAGGKVKEAVANGHATPTKKVKADVDVAS